MEIDLSIVVAMTQHHIIGDRGKLPWYLPGDLAHFQKITTEVGTMIIGYTTYLSIIARNHKPLPKRKHIVLTRKNIPSSCELVTFVRSPEAAIAEVAKNGGRACVIGGGEIFKIFLPMLHVTKAYITKVHAPKLFGDTIFPAMVPSVGTCWKCVDFSEPCKKDPCDEYETSFEV
ncbi:MAG: dihydrofolate reductase, partial [Patescibacteria group bacterium]